MFSSDNESQHLPLPGNNSNQVHSSARMAFAERSHVGLLYGTRPSSAASRRSDTLYPPGGSGLANGHPTTHKADNSATLFEYIGEKVLESMISYYAYLCQIITACALMLILFALVVPICTIVLSAIHGGHAEQIPGYLSPLAFTAVAICVYVTRTKINANVNILSLFVAAASLSALAMALSMALVVVAIVQLGRDSPSPYGRGNSATPHLLEILSMECAIVSSGVLAFLLSLIMLLVYIHFIRSVFRFRRRTQTESSSSSTITTLTTPTQRPAPPPVMAAEMARTDSRPSSRQSLRPSSSIPMVVIDYDDSEIYDMPVIIRDGVRFSARSQASLNDIDIQQDVRDPPNGGLDFVAPTITDRTNRRWGRTKNVLRAIMDLKDQ